MAMSLFDNNISVCLSDRKFEVKTNKDVSTAKNNTIETINGILGNLFF
jgi:hypothetical protein